MESTAGGSVAIVLTLVVLEAVLSFDNAAILAVMSRRLPAGQGRNRALNYGLLIAYGLRFLAILGTALLYRNPWFQVLGGAYLIFLFGRHLAAIVAGRQSVHHVSAGPVKSVLGLSPLTVIILQIAFIDLAFAVDQVTAAVGFTRDYWLVMIAAGIGLVALRVLAPLMSRLMDWLPLLEHMAYFAVGFVGALLLMANLVPLASLLGLHPVLPAPAPFFEWVGFHVGEAGDGYDLLGPVKVGLTLSLFAVPVLLKFFFGIPASRRPAQATVTKVLEGRDRRPGKRRP